MTQKNNPSSFDLLVGVLRFLASSAPEQLEELNEYRNVCEVSRAQAHIENPFVELTEGLVKIYSPDYVSLLSIEAKVALEQIQDVVERIFGEKYGCLVDDSAIEQKPQWEQVRRLAADLLAKIDTKNIPKLSVWTLLSFIAD